MKKYRVYFIKLQCLVALALFSFTNSFSQIYINEIMVNAAGANDGANMPNTSEWLEFYNSSSSPVNIGCWYFTDGDFAVTFPSGTTIPAGGYYTVASATGSGLSPNLDWGTCGCTTNNPGNNITGNQIGIFTNGNEQIMLYNSSNVLQDAIIWGSGQLVNVTLTITAVGGCGTRTVAITTSTVGFENIGTQSDGIAKERDYDGSTTWQNNGAGTFGTSNGANPLPIELLYFNAQTNGKEVHLNWSTATEINNAYFTVERSKDGINFETVTTIKGAGNSSNFNNYETIDGNPHNGLSYYRLKQTDFDGKFTYSKIISVENILISEVKLYPNPTNDGRFTISLNETVESNIEVINDIGQTLFKESVMTPSHEIDLQRFSKGIYLVLITIQGEVISKKIIYQ